ncbi:MAG TPA: glycerophosphodiester phosphodiesterase family protein [Rhodopila sp.]
MDIQGHRGARGLFPENTLEGFLAAERLGLTAFELDVGLTADRIPVVTHDLALNPDIARDASGAWLSETGPLICSLTCSELSRYDVGRLRPGSRTAALFPDQRPLDGARIPTLAAVLAALPTSRFTVEIKTHPSHPDWTASPAELADAALRIMDAAGDIERFVMTAFDWRVLRHVRRSRPDVRLAWLTRPQTVIDALLWWDGVEIASSVPAAVAAEGGPIWAPEHTTLHAADIAEAHALGLLVLPWTVNQPSDMKRLMDWGADGLTSDRPDLVLTA